MVKCNMVAIYAKYNLMEKSVRRHFTRAKMDSELWPKAESWVSIRWNFKSYERDSPTGSWNYKV